MYFFPAGNVSEGLAITNFIMAACFTPSAYMGVRHISNEVCCRGRVENPPENPRSVVLENARKPSLSKITYRRASLLACSRAYVSLLLSLQFRPTTAAPVLAASPRFRVPRTEPLTSHLFWEVCCVPYV